MYALLRQTMRLLAATILFRKLHVEGVHNVPQHGGVLVIGNHIATVDPPLTGAMIRRLDVYYMAKAENFSSRGMNWLCRAYHAFPVVRGSADRTALRRSIQILKDGHVLVVYPEGSRSPDATLTHPQAGIGFLARHARVPIVPVAIWGTENVLPKGARRPHRNHVHIRFGEPFEVPEVDAADGKLSHQATTDLMVWRIAEMLPHAYRGVFTSAARVGAAAPRVE